MELAAVTVAATSWPDAAVAIAGVALVGGVAVVVVWQALATWRARITVTRDEDAYHRLTERMLYELREINERLDRIERSREGAEPRP